MNTLKDGFDAQLEMSFDRTVAGDSPRRRRQGRAHWWFQRMRALVDGAMDWQPAPPPRPEQIWFKQPVAAEVAAGPELRDAA